MDTIFSLSSLLVMPLWLAMIVLPRWRWTARVLGSPWSIAPAAGLYAVLVLPALASVWPVVSRPELGSVAALLSTPEGATIAWVHFLAFDLFVGRWAYLDSRERGISAWVMAPVLFLILMLGPLGFLAYLGVRSAVALRRRERAPDVAGSGGTLPATVSPRGERLRSVLRVNRPLALTAALMAVLALATLVGIALDPRQVTGAPAWLKPFKFAVSISVYSFTLLWMLSLVQGRPRTVRVVATATAVAFVVEWVVIALQAFRGVPSHFNASTPLDTALFSVMGVFVMVLWAMNLVAAVLLLRQSFQERSFAWSLRLGLILSLVGGLMAVPMLGPTAEQRAALQAGGRVEMIGAHAVGVADGGAGLPVVGWSTEGGDLRVPHFFGLHGLQVLPLVGFLLGRARRLREDDRWALVMTAGASYLGLTGILFWQALRGEPLIAPSTTILTATVLWAAATLLAGAAVLLRALRDPGRAEVRLARAA